MKILLLLLIFIQFNLCADANYEVKLYEKILPVIFHKQPLKVFVDKDTRMLLKDSAVFIIVDSCDNTVLLIGKEFPSLSEKCKEKPLFATNYLSYHNQKNSFGAFYWRKGRPQLKFKKTILEKFNMVLPNSLKEYIDD